MPDNRTLSEKLASHISDPLLLIYQIAKHIDENEGVDLNQVNLDMIGAPNGVAPLDGTGKVPAINLPSGGGGGASDWGDLGGTLSDQTDLQAALDLKADLADLHSPTELLDSDDDVSVDGEARQAYDSTGATSLDWQSRRLMAGGADSVHYGNRTLGHAGGGVAASWDEDGLVVNGALTADGFKSDNFTDNRLLAFNSADEMVATPFGYDPALFDGAVWAHTVLPTNADDNKNLHYLGISINPAVADARQSWTGKLVEIGLGTDSSGNKIGDPIDLKGSLVLQDITYTGKRNGADNNVITIEYTAGATAGAEVVTSPSDFEYVIQIEDGVSTAQQIVDAITNSANPGNILGTIGFTITGTASNAQDIEAQQNITGGVNAFGTVTGSVVSLFSRQTSDTGSIVGQSAFIDFGNGTDAISGRNLSGFTGNIVIRDNADVQNATAFEFSFGVGTTNSSIEQDLNGVSIYGNVDTIGFGLKGVSIGLSVGEMLYANIFQATIAGVDVEQSVNVFADFSNYSGTIGNQYYGLAIQPNINQLDGGFFGINISPNITLADGNSTGINVNMAGITVYPGVKSSLTLQDLHFEAVQPGSGNDALQIEYVDDGTAGAETIGIVGNLVTVHMEDGVSTAQNIYDALTAIIQFVATVTVTITGTAGDPQTAVGPTNLAGGINAGTKRAAYFGGDVQIDGSLSFSGALSIGALNAYHSQALVDGGGVPSAVHMLITAPTVGDNVTLTTGDLLGVNTAMLFTVGANSTVGTSFLGVSALGLPAVVTIGAGSTVDKVAGATFAISLDPGSAGNIDNVFLCRAVALPGGTTTVGKLFGFEMDMPFGDVGTDAWGVYISPDIDNWMKGSLKIGGTAGASDQVSNSSIALEVTAKAIRLATMDTTARDALTALQGMMIFNTTTSALEVYDGAAWV